MKIAYVVDSTASLKEDLASHPDVYWVNLSIIYADGDVYVDSWDEASIQDFYDRLERETDLPTTSQAEPSQYLEIFNHLVDQGYERVYCITLSSKISGTFQTMSLVAQEYAQDLDIHMIDSRGTSIAIQNLVEEAMAMEARGLPVADIVAELHWIAEASRIYVLIDNYENLIKGGRVSSLAALLGKSLRIVPIIYFDQEGQVGIYKKVRTLKASYRQFWQLIEAAEEKFPQGFYLDFAHGAAHDKMALVESELAQRFPEKDYQVVYLTPVLGVHGGKGALGMGIIPKARI